MKTTFIFATILAVISIDLNDIAKINSLKEEAEEAYLKGDYKTAFERYHILVDSFEVADDNVLLNYANSGYFLTGLKGKIDQAPSGSENSPLADITMSNYQKLTTSKDGAIRSAAYNQLGVINYQMNSSPQGSQKLDESLAYFKQSLKSSSLNDHARYNYEVVKKKLEDQKNQDQQENQNEDQKNEDKKEENEEKKDQENQNQDEEQKQDQEKQDEENQEKQEQEEQQNKDGEKQENQEQQEQEEEQQQQEESEEQKENEEQQSKSLSEKLEEMKISEDMAKMILEALRNNEVQYIQQQKRRPTKKADGTKPDW